jgi:hypothetical protein
MFNYTNDYVNRCNYQNHLTAVCGQLCGMHGNLLEGLLYTEERLSLIV